MNLEQIKEILSNDSIVEFQKEYMILKQVVKNKKDRNALFEMINNVIEEQEELITDSNMELSRALIVLKDKNLKTTKKVIVDPKWVADEILKHYDKWKHLVRNNFSTKAI